MAPISDQTHRRLLCIAVLIVAVACLSAPSLAHDSGSCPFSSSSSDPHHHQHHHHDHHHDHSHARKLPEELAEEADLELERSLKHDHHDHHHHPTNYEPNSLSLWMSAMGCSLLVSMASLICLILLPVLFMKGKPSKVVVDALATFGAGAMLGDAFLHQLPHAFGGEHSHSHDYHIHDHHHEVTQLHSHSLQDLSVGLSVLFGIVLFLLVEKVVRYVEDVCGKGASTMGHGHHHRSHSKLKDEGHSKLKDEDGDDTNNAMEVASSKPDKKIDSHKVEKQVQHGDLRKRANMDGTTDAKGLDATDNEFVEKDPSTTVASRSSSSSLVFGYLNLFSDGVHNFTDGMALGNAFLLYGSVGGWSRTLFLLAHELPQEVGDFGILVRSGFTASKALFFNFLSALVALVGTALALLLGKDPGQSSLIEGFTAGGFIYIAVAGVLPELNNGSTSVKNSAIQLSSLILGMAVALGISLAE